MNLIPGIVTSRRIQLMGQNLTVSFANDRTVELWKSFSSRRNEIKNVVNADFYAVDIYPNTSFFEQFDPTKEYTKWAAVEVSDTNYIPVGMQQLVIPEGLYAVFHYKGKPSQAQGTIQYIYGEWLPNSEYKMDNRPYFALMGEKYKGEHPDSEEEFWIPICRK